METPIYMDNTTPIIEKIKKLLALANSSNKHEAALAASHAQRLLLEHNLVMADRHRGHLQAGQGRQG